MQSLGYFNRVPPSHSPTSTPMSTPPFTLADESVSYLPVQGAFQSSIFVSYLEH